MSQSLIFNYETLVHAIAGATGSIVAMSCFYPLDNIRFRNQMGDKVLLEKSTFEALFYLLKNEGVESLYRGMKPVITSLGISNFVYFYTFHGLRSYLPKNLRGSTKSDLAFSICAGIVNVIVTCPLWVTNSRLKMSNNLEYKGLTDGMLYIGKHEGLKALWKGLGPSLVLVSNPAIHFTIYEALKRNIPVKSAAAYFMLSALSKTIATVVTYPLQLAQTRQRLAENEEASTLEILLSILKNNGPSSLFQGLESKVLQTVLSAALMFMAYEKIAQFVFALLLSHHKRSCIKS